MRLKASGHSSSGRSRLITDQAGATMVMGVFMAALLVGMIYYVWGIGDAVMHRERMQDASDTAAFSAAVIHARGMNMLALLNMIMGTLATIAATMATISAMINYAFLAATATCAFCPECPPCCAACPIAIRHGIEDVRAARVSSRTTRTVRNLLRGFHAYAVGIRVGAPLAAEAKVIAYGREVYRPVTTIGAMLPLPVLRDLPAQDDETNWPCNEKVLPFFHDGLVPGVRTLAPIFVWIFGSPSPYMAIGIAAGELDAGRFAREWCPDYFQRIPDNAQEMGNMRYQLHAYMLGDHDLEWTQTGVAIAAWGEGESAGAQYTRIAELGRVSFAQGEFFYDDPEDDWHEWLWHMNWRARLRRWRLENSGGVGSCSFCGDLVGLSGVNEMVVH